MDKSDSDFLHSQEGVWEICLLQVAEEVGLDWRKGQHYEKLSTSSTYSRKHDRIQRLLSSNQWSKIEPEMMK